MRQRARSWFVLAAGIILLLAAGVLLLHESEGEEPARTSAAATDAALAAAPAAAVDDTTTKDLKAGSELRRTEPPPPTVDAASTAAAAPTPTTARVHGRCVDLLHRPLPGCDLSCVGAPAGAMPRTRSGADGTFEFVIALGDDVIIAAVQAELRDATAVTHRLDEVIAGRSYDLGDFVLVAGTPVHGRIVDLERKPFAGAGVTFLDATVREGMEPLGQVVAQADADGRFDTLLAPGTWEVKTVLQRLSAGSVRIGDDAAAIEVMLAPLVAAVSITGTVVDPEGKPVFAHIARVLDGNGRQDSLPLAATEDGAFELTASAGTEAYTLAVIADGYLPWRTAAPVPFGTRDLRVVLTPAAPASLRLLDQEGAPVVDAQVFLWRGGLPPGRMLDGPFPDGIVAMGPLPAGTCRVLVAPADPALGCTARLQLRFAAGSCTDIRVPRRAERTLQLRRGDGSPVPATNFELLDEPPRRLAERGVVRTGWRTTGGAPLLLQGGSTDARGEARLSGPADRPLALVLRGEHAVVVATAVSLDVDAPLVVTVGTGASLRVRLGPAAAMGRHFELAGGGLAADPARFRLRLHRADDRPHREDKELRFTADASCRGEQLVAGLWQLSLSLDYHQLAQLAPMHLVDGEARDVDIDLEALLPAVLQGRLAVDGGHLVGATVTLHRLGDTGAGSQFEASTDRAGHFRAVAPAATYAVAVTLPGGGPPIGAGDDVVLAVGAVVERDFAVRTSTLRLRVVDAAGVPAALVALHLRSSHGGDFAMLITDADGRTAITIGSGDRHAVEAWPRAQTAPVLLGEVDGGGASETVLMLPAGFCR